MITQRQMLTWRKFQIYKVFIFKRWTLKVTSDPDPYQSQDPDPSSRMRIRGSGSASKWYGSETLLIWIYVYLSWYLKRFRPFFLKLALWLNDNGGGINSIFKINTHYVRNIPGESPGTWRSPTSYPWEPGRRLSLLEADCNPIYHIHRYPSHIFNPTSSRRNNDTKVRK